MRNKKLQTPYKQKIWRPPKAYLSEFQIYHVAISHSNYKEIQNTQVFSLTEFKNLSMPKNVTSTAKGLQDMEFLYFTDGLELKEHVH